MKVTGLSIRAGEPAAVTATEQESGRSYTLSSRAVINATGVMCDRVRRLDEASCSPLITTSQGAHLVLDRSFLPGNSAIMIPKTDDGRVFFAIPWYDRVIIGTTDTPLDEAVTEPVPLSDEIDFLLAHAGRCLERKPNRSDILSCFAGLRPLVRGKAGQTTAQLSREFLLSTSPSGLVTITGGKWTTYRSMAVAAVDAAAVQGGLPAHSPDTYALRLHGWAPFSGSPDRYGSERNQLDRLTAEQPEWAKTLHPRLSCTAAEIVWAVRCEWARTVEDVLARRTRALFLDARASKEIAPQVAALMAAELGRDQAWQNHQLELFSATAARHLPA
jgi:glycerol-3-phosphate dehydrogenase